MVERSNNKKQQNQIYLPHNKGEFSGEVLQEKRKNKQPDSPISGYLKKAGKHICS